MRRAIWLTMIVAAMPAFAESPGQAASRFLAETLAADRGPGMMAAAVRDGCLVWSDASGHADLEQRVPMSTETRMRIGSVSKTLTAALAAKMAQADHMDIDEDIRVFVPGFPDKGRPITARQLAAHTSGIRHYDFSDMAEANNVRYYERLEDALAVFSGDYLLAAPGERFEYSSFAFNLLGVAAANAAGTSFAEALAVHITAPLGVENTLIDHPLLLIPRRTRFYTVVDGGSVINTIWRDSSDYYPSGGILSTAEDLARFAYAVFDGDLLDDARKALVREPARTNEGETITYTFGWEISQPDGELRFSHGGETNGAYARVVYLPKPRLAVAGITNYNFWGQSLGEPAFFRLIQETLPDVLAGADCR